MMEQITDIASWVFIVLGSFFIVAGAAGMLRMPDLFTRMHAASVIETLGATLLVVGLMLQAGFTLISAKLIFVLLLFFFTGPVAAHALAQAALHAGVEPMLDEDRRSTEPPGGAEKNGTDSAEPNT